MPTLSHDRPKSAIRLYSSAVRAVPSKDEAARGCQAFHMLKADPVQVGPLSRRPEHVTMPFAPFGEVLDQIEFHGLSEGEALARLSAPDRSMRRRVHEGLAVWVRHAVRLFRDRLAADLAAAGAHDVVAVRPWVHQIPAGDPNSRTRELCVWGRAYTYGTAQGVTRELRVPCMGGIRNERRGDAEKSVMAYVVAVGSLIDTTAFEQDRGRYLGGIPFPVLPPASAVPGAKPPDHVRVLEVSCTDGEAAPVFEGSVEAARVYFAEHGRAALHDLFRSGDRRPGYDCLECKDRKRCERLPRASGMLGIRDASRPRRVFTVTSGRYHGECAAKEHYRNLRLPVDEERENTPPVRQGKAVHAWIQRLHDRSPRRPCTEKDLPENPGCWEVDTWRLEGAEARDAAAMLAAHLEVCPYLGLSADAPAHPERILVADDRHSDTLVVAHADLVYRRGDSWNYREIKTTSSQEIVDGDLLLRRYQQLALAILLYESGVIPLGPQSAVELEILTPNGPDLRVLSPNSASLREAARREIHPLAAAWHRDAAHLANPGPICKRCPYHMWCPSADHAAGGARGA